MVSFSCENCQDTIKKPKLENHASRCYGPFTCIDCNVTFQGRDWKTHNQCISEEQKYQKGDMRGKGPKKANGQQTPVQQARPAPVVSEPTAVVKTEEKKESNGLVTAVDEEHREGNKKDKKDKTGKKEKKAKMIKNEEDVKSEGGEKEKKKTKKEKKSKVDDTVSTVSSVTTETNGETVAEPKEKKRKRSREDGVDPEMDTSNEAPAKKDKKRKASEVESKEKDSEPKPKKKKSKKDINGTTETSPSLVDSDTPMPDITTLLLPDLTPQPPIQNPTQTSSIHPSRLKNFTSTPTPTILPPALAKLTKVPLPPALSNLADLDPSYLPRPKDIARARRALNNAANPPKKSKAKLSLEEKRAKRKSKEEKRNAPPVVHVPKPVVITRDPIEDPVKHFVEGLTAEPQKLGDLVARCKDDVRSGGGRLNIARGLLGRFALRREGDGEDGSGGRIVLQIVERKPLEAEASDDDDDSD